MADRDADSLERLPVYQHGAIARWAAVPPDLAQPATTWGPPRITYLQHASDPIVWWSPDLLLHQPDWLREPRGADVLPATQWLPWVTFWQVTADMVYSTGVPDGHGHVYKREYVDAWAAVTQPARLDGSRHHPTPQADRLGAARSRARFNRVLTVAPDSVQSEDGPRAERLRRGRSLAASGHAERTGETGCPLERERAMVSHHVRVGHRVLVVVASAAVVTSMSWAGAASANQQASSRPAPTSGST